MYTLVIMSKDTVLNVKIDKELKKQAQAAARAIDLPVSTIVTASLREFVRTRSITIRDEGILKPEIVAELIQISADAKKGINVSPTFDTVEESFEWLDKELARERARLKHSA